MKWVNVLCAEWRNLDDPAAASVLYRLFANETVAWKPSLAFIVLGAATIGVFVAFAHMSAQLFTGTASSHRVLLSFVSGAGIGGLVLFASRLRSSPVWQLGYWLSRLAPQRPTLAVQQGKTLVTLVESLVYSAAALLFLWLIVFFVTTDSLHETTAYIVGLVVVTGLLWTALKRSLVLWLFLGSLTAMVAGILIYSLRLGSHGSDWGSWGWMIASGFGVVIVGTTYSLFSPSDPHVAFEHREAFKWWNVRPTRQQMRQALRDCGTPASLALLECMKSAEHKSSSVDLLVSELGAADSIQRYVARHALVVLGGAAIDTTLGLGKRYALDGAIHWILGGVELETRLYNHHSESWRCTRHWATLREHKITWEGKVFSFWACRVPDCRQTQNVERTSKVVCDASADPAKLRKDDSVYHVPWEGELFDFDEVYIGKVETEQVRRFVVQVNEDSDALRRKRYARILCIVGSQARLPENVVRNLRQCFGSVRLEAESS